MSSQCRSFVIADLHLSHENVCKFTRESGEGLRPWDNIDEMNEALIDNWNGVVRDSDKVYVLGDFTVNKKFVHLGSRLNGRKILVKGNHDNGKIEQYVEAGFEDIVGCHVMYKQAIIMTHIPVHPYQLTRFSGGNMHGHTHDGVVMRDNVVDSRYLCVSVEQPHVNYVPMLLDALAFVVELVDTLDLESSAATRGSSTLPEGTNCNTGKYPRQRACIPVKPQPISPLAKR